MAITRAQQFKQMLREGGRTGFFLGGNFQQSEEQKQRDRDISREEARRSRDDDDAGMPSQPTPRPRPKPIIKPDSEGPDFGPRFGIPRTTAQKKALQNYLNQVDLAMYGKDPLVIGDEEDADSIDDLLTSGTDATKLLEDDKKSE